EKAIGLPSDAFIFDLEDSVPPAEKAKPRPGVRAYAGKISDNRVWVRVNALDTGLAEADLDAVIGIAGIAGLFLPKVETREEVARWDGMIGALEHARGVNPGALKLVLSIESALGVLNAHVMATVAARVVSLTFGGAQDGDLNTDLGCAWSIDGPEMLHARAHTLLAARAARFDSPLDGVVANVRDAEGFERDTALSRRLGCRGRELIHPPPAGAAAACASSSIARRSSRATGSTARARQSWTITPVCWRHSTRRWRKAAPRPPSTAA